MKLKRIKSVPGKRWKKGHSCATNPDTTKYRDAAKSNSFIKIEGESELTAEAVAEHNAVISDKPSLYANSEDDKTIGRTFRTFATNYTTCTIPAFEKFFKNFTVESELQTRMLAIHAAAQEYLQEANLPESSTSYMCALMVSLEGLKDSEEDVTAILSLLAKVIRKVAKEVLRANFGKYSQLFEEIMKTFQATSNTKLLINVIGCLSILLRAQSEVQWTYSSTMNLFHIIISYTTHENADLRRSAQYNVSAVLKASFIDPEKIDDEDEEDEMDVDQKEVKKTPRFIHPAATSVGKFIEVNLKLASNNKKGNATLYLLILLQSVVSCLSGKVLRKCCEIVLGVMVIGDEVIKSRALKVFGSLFSSEIELNVDRLDCAITTETIDALINVLTKSDAKNSDSLKLIPGINNADLSIVWMNTVASGIICTAKKNEADGIEVFTCWMELLTVFWKSDYDSVHEKVWHMIDYIFDEIIKPLEDRISTYTTVLFRSFNQISKCLSLQYECAWPFVLKSLSIYFRVLGRYCTEEMRPCLKNLIKMIETPDITEKKQLEEAIGAAVYGMGPEVVLKDIPIKITGNIEDDEVHFWILPVLKKFVKETRLAFFVSHFVPITNSCFIIVRRMEEQGKMNSVLAKTYQQIERQIWALLPNFADVALDVEEALSVQVHAVDAVKNNFTMQSFVQLIGSHIKNRSDTRLDFMAALRNMLKCDTASTVFSYFSKNFLPILFNVYLLKPREKFPKLPLKDVVDSGQRLAAFSTIKAYISRIPAEKTSTFFILSFKKFDEESSDMFRKKTFLDLTVPFILHLKETALSDIFLKIKGYIETKNFDLQKSAYRILEEIFCAESETSKQFINERVEEIGLLLINSADNVVLNARAHRLKCLLEFLPFLPSDISNKKCKPFFKQLIQESINYCGRTSSSSTRKAAFALLREVGEEIQRIRKISFEKSFEYCYKLMPRLTPPSDTTANTVLALMALSYLYDDMLDTKIALRSIGEISKLLASNKRDVIKSCLGFLRVIFSQYSPVLLSDFVDDVVGNIVQMPIKDRLKFRIKIRDIFSSLIRKFGVDRIKDLVPEDDSMSTMLKNIIKMDNRKKRTKKEEEEYEDDIVEAPTSLNQILDELDREIEDDNDKKLSKHKKLKGKAAGKKKKLTWIKEDEDEIIDLLDESTTHNITNKNPKSKRLLVDEKAPQTDEEKYGFKVDKITNKFIIKEKYFDRDDEDYDDDKDDDDDDNDTEDFMPLGELAKVLPKKEHPQKESYLKENLTLHKSLKRKRLNSDSISEYQSVKSVAGSSIGGKSKKKRFDYGSEFRSKKAGGDVASKGGVAPYAYVQLSKDKLNKRKQAKYAGQFKNLVKGAKRGAVKGSKIRSRKK